MNFFRWKKAWLESLVVFSLVFGLVFQMYGVPKGPVLYGFTLSFSISILYLARAYVQYRKKKKKLEMFLQKDWIEEEKLEAIKGEDGFEREYLRLIRKLNQDRIRCEQRRKKSEEKSREYYTRWSHQIKTPIAAVNLLLSEAKTDIRAVRREIFRIEQYADMALQYQRLEGEQNDLVLGKTDLQKMVRQVLKKISSIFIHKKLQVELGEFENTVITDEKWICFILEQLLMNAVKYTPEKGKIAIWMESSALLIQDHGIGIRQEDLPRVFEWGYTGHNGRLDKKSTGIGLALVRQASQMLQIEISLTSEVGKGTIVRLEFPVYESKKNRRILTEM